MPKESTRKTPLPAPLECKYCFDALQEARTILADLVSIDKSSVSNATINGIARAAKHCIDYALPFLNKWAGGKQEETFKDK